MRTKLHASVFELGLIGVVLALCAVPVARLNASGFQSEPQSPRTAPKLQPQQSKPRLLEFKGTVMTFNTASITVRSERNMREVQSFTYSPKLHDKAVALMQKGGYQNGDKVTVKFAEGTTVAEEISGKPSKPKTF